MADKWQILPQGQRKTVKPAPGGMGFQTVWEVSYRVTSGPAEGTVSSVEIPAESYNAATVAAAIDAQVAHLDAVAGL